MESGWSQAQARTRKATASSATPGGTYRPLASDRQQDPRGAIALDHLAIPDDSVTDPPLLDPVAQTTWVDIYVTSASGGGHD